MKLKVREFNDKSYFEKKFIICCLKLLIILSIFKVRYPRPLNMLVRASACHQPFGSVIWEYIDKTPTKA